MVHDTKMKLYHYSKDSYKDLRTLEMQKKLTEKEKEVAMKKIEDKDKQGKLVMGQAQHEIVADVDYEGVVAIKSNSARQPNAGHVL